MNQQETSHFLIENSFTPIDWQTMQVLLSSALEKTEGKKKEAFLQEENLRPIAFLFLLLSRLSQMGKMHLFLPTWAGKKIMEQYPHLPELDELESKLEKFYQKGGKKIITKNENLLKPIAWCNDYLYFSKNLFFEKTITNEIQNRVEYNEKNDSPSNILKNRLTIIDGGPGSGKTTLILALVACLFAEDEKTSIKLLAPTGKATNRLKQSLITSLMAVKKDKYFFSDLPVFSQVTDFAFFNDRHFLEKLRYLINDMEIETVHRFLKIKPGYVLDDKNKDLSKSYDCLIIDEASMISPTLLARLFLSIRHDAKLIMLGDRHQLPSIDNENLIAYLTKNFFKQASDTLIDLSLLRQNKNYRFSKESSIAIVANALKNFMNQQLTETDEKNSQLAASVINTFEKESEKNSDFKWYSHLEKKIGDGNHLPAKLAERLKKFLLSHHLEFSKLLKRTKNQNDRHHKLFEHFFQKMVLTSHRHGPLGQKAISSLVEREIIKTKNLFDTENPYHEGRVVIFLSNDYDNQIMNGDIAIILKDRVGMPKFHLYLSSRTIPVYAIKPQAMETLYALTVHKSQGSEFDQTYLIFSPETHEENYSFSFLSPSLLYTAITRSKKSATLYLEKSTLEYLLLPKTHQ